MQGRWILDTDLDAPARGPLCGQFVHDCRPDAVGGELADRRRGCRADQIVA